MKITKAALKRIIKEEISKAIKEELSWDPSASMGALDADFPAGVDAIPDKQVFMKQVYDIVTQEQPNVDPATVGHYAIEAWNDSFKRAVRGGRRRPPTIEEIAATVLSGLEVPSEESIRDMLTRHGRHTPEEIEAFLDSRRDSFEKHGEPWSTPGISHPK